MYFNESSTWRVPGDDPASSPPGSSDAANWPSNASLDHSEQKNHSGADDSANNQNWFANDIDCWLDTSMESSDAHHEGSALPAPRLSSFHNKQHDQNLTRPRPSSTTDMLLSNLGGSFASLSDTNSGKINQRSASAVMTSSNGTGGTSSSSFSTTSAAAAAEKDESLFGPSVLSVDSDPIVAEPPQFGTGLGSSQHVVPRSVRLHAQSQTSPQSNAAKFTFVSVPQGPVKKTLNLPSSAMLTENAEQEVDVQCRDGISTYLASSFREVLDKVDPSWAIHARSPGVVVKPLELGSSPSTIASRASASPSPTSDSSSFSASGSSGSRPPSSSALRVGSAQSSIYASKLQRDIDSLLNVSATHPHLLEYIQALEDSSKNRYLLVYRLPSGPTLETLAKSGRLSLLDSRALCGQIMRGLEALHSRGVVHGGLAPDSVYLRDVSLREAVVGDIQRYYMSSSSSFRVSVWDASEIQRLQHDGHHESIVTTAARFSKQSDIFSAGCLLYYLLSGGCHPFTSRNDPNAVYDDVEAIASSICSDKDVSLAEAPLPALAIDLVSRMIVKDARHRLPVAKVCAHPFFWDEATRVRFLSSVVDFVCSSSVSEEADSSVANQLRSLFELHYKRLSGGADPLPLAEALTPLCSLESLSGQSVWNTLSCVRDVCTRVCSAEPISPEVQSCLLLPRFPSNVLSHVSLFFETSHPLLLPAAFCACEALSSAHEGVSPLKDTPLASYLTRHWL